ncbi:MAG TPA: TetR/AcrR family transcriptional regulator [Solirubrobacteraceae bacterium]|nr:TetR/AcrR family transcriptional regulator [Solirubrobacteraceae bacterium]
MGSSQSEKTASHERIVRAASARIRRDGVDGLTVAELMGAAGLTHGGFYRHFDSREELVAEAVEAALEHGARRTAKVVVPEGADPLGTIVDGYLGKQHRDRPDSGCAVAALSADVSRAGPRVRAAYASQVGRSLELLAGLLGDDGPHDVSGSAHLILAALVGALSIARAVGDTELSDEILERTAQALHRYIDAAA